MPRLTVNFVVLLLTWSRHAGAQAPDSDFVERGPRFLLASAAAPVPVRVDVIKTPVLRQSISLDLNGVALGDALREISAKAGMQLAFSNTMLPAERTVTFRADHITVAAALTEVLVDAQVDVLFSRNGRAVLVRRADFQGGTVSGRVADAKTGKAVPNVSVYLEGTRWRTNTGEDGTYRLVDVTAGAYTLTASRIGYAKQRRSLTVAAGQEVTADFALQAAATELDEVVVAGTVVPTERKAIPTPISVVTGDEIEEKGYQRVEQLFRGDIPGVIAWDEGSHHYLSDINIRGASSLNYFNSVKTYIDGVEVADPQYLATIDPASIERIELLRGPEGSTVYGAQALSGVMQIFTKHGTLNTPQPQVEAKVAAGEIQSQWGNTAQTDNSLAVSGGGQEFSYRLGGGFLHNGDWAPESKSTNGSLYGSIQGTTGALTTEVSARYYSKSVSFAESPLLASYAYFSKPFNQINSVRQQTEGITFKYAASAHWQHRLVLGYDRTGYEYYLTKPRFVTPADSFLYVYRSDETKASVAYNTTYEVSLGPATRASLTAGADHWNYHLDGFFASGLTQTNNLSSAPGGQVSRSQYDNSGYFAQGQLGVWDAVYLTAGLRAEDNQNFGKDFGLFWAPRVGVSYVRMLGDITAKARVAYGTAIRPPDPGTTQNVVTSFSTQLANPNLGPEEQRGVDGGVELYFGQRGSLEANYYHQTAINLIDVVVLPESTYTYQNQNVGRISNTGWEFQGRINGGPLSLTGTYSITRSMVEQLSPTYGGDLRAGDQMLHIPKYIAGATLSYGLPRTAISLEATHIGSWTEFTPTGALDIDATTRPVQEL